MNKLVPLLLLLITTLATHLSSSTLDQQPPATNAHGYLFEIHGSNTIGAHLAPALVKQWLTMRNFKDIESKITETQNEQEVWARTSQSNQQVKIKIAAHGSGTGFEQIKAGRADIAAASRPIKHQENAMFPTINLSRYENESVLGIDGLAIIVHPQLNLSHLTIAQIGLIFSGEVTRWSELGGPDLDISIHARDDKSGTFDTFKALVLSRGYSLAGNALRFESNDELSRQVATTPGSIGFTAFANIGRAKALAIIDGQSLPMQPSVSNIATEDYPLSRRLYLYQANTENSYALDFLAFVKTQQGQAVVEDTGFVSQNLTELAGKANDAMPNGYRFLVQRAARLTTNFRFVPGTKQLDNKAIDDIERLTEYMKRPSNKHRSVFLVGFVNKQSSEFRAQILSEARVYAVKNALRAAGIETNAMTGYGEINPVSDNSEERYALRNQRVEVWIK